MIVLAQSNEATCDDIKKQMKAHSMMQLTKEKDDNMRLENIIKSIAVATSVQM
jgi:hypothetical protein